MLFANLILLSYLYLQNLSVFWNKYAFVDIALIILSLLKYLLIIVISKKLFDFYELKKKKEKFNLLFI